MCAEWRAIPSASITPTGSRGPCGALARKVQRSLPRSLGAEALDRVAEAFLKAGREWGAEGVWPYFYAGTMGLVMRDGIDRLTHVKRYSRFFGNICVGIAWPGYIAGTGRMSGVSPSEMAKSEVVVIWGTNAAATQVDLMTHAMRARKEHGAKIVAIDIYPTETMRQADLALQLRPGTDGALACAVMHALFRDGLADRDYMMRYTDAPAELEAHLRDRSPLWASAIAGLGVEKIEAFAALVGRHKRTFFRLGYGFSRQRNGAANMQPLSIAAVTGAWAQEGGGALHASSAVYKLDRTLIQGLDACDVSVRRLDQSRVGDILTGDREALKGGGPVKAMLIQNTNPMVVAPDQAKVRQGFAREDLFVCVHEQFMTDTARFADVVLPATMFLEHDDIYTASAHQFFQFAPKTIDPPEGCRWNHYGDLRARSPARRRARGLDMSPREIIDETLRISGRGPLAELEAARWLDCQPPFETAHFLNGFAHGDGKFPFWADWANVPYDNDGLCGPWRGLPSLPTIGRSTKGRTRTSLQARDLACAQLPQFELQPDCDLARPRGPPKRAHASRGHGGARIERGRHRAPRQCARRDPPACEAVGGGDPRHHRQRGPLG